ncbi:hypothetical protein F4824DRAFT_509924 [Ustulina deusta]|nr:hypothetical protein F4824DRAFT_509924 [Ustulina deusta]
MGQSFQLIAPRAKLALSWSGKLGEILFDGSARDLVCLLAVPVRRQHDSPRNSLVDPTNTICEEKRGAKRSRDNNNVQTESPRCRKQIKVQGRNGKTVSNAVIALSSLPPEIHRLYFLSIGHKCLEDYYASHFGRWASTNVVCIGHNIKPNNYPPGLFSNEELEVLRQKTTDIPNNWKYPDNGAIRNEPFTLEHFTYQASSCTLQSISKNPAYLHIRPHFKVTNKTYFPTDQQWILQNLTTKQIVHSNAIALSPDYISSPNIQVLGFGKVVMSHICWSTSSHKVETRGEEWKDMSEEVAKKIASIWESEYGSNWREIIYKCWPY